MADQGEWVEFPGPGGTFKAFVAQPDLPPPWPTLICIHAASGLDAHHQNVTRNFARHPGRALRRSRGARYLAGGAGEARWNFEASASAPMDCTPSNR